MEEAETEHPGVVVLEAFCEEIRSIFGFVVESDEAFLQLYHQFRHEAQTDPHRHNTWVREFKNPQDVQLPYVTKPHQYAATTQQLADNYSMYGRNRLLRNRAAVLYLYELWNCTYRKQLAASVGKQDKEIVSDVFGDLRHYRNAIAHKGVLKAEARVLRFVNVGEPVNLTPWEVDTIFDVAIGELNRLAQAYLGLRTNFSLDQFSPAWIVYRGPAYGDVPPDEEVEE